MKDFYVQLMSNAGTLEFPANKPNHFKNRMPYPLQFREPGWKVGVTGLSLPEAPRKMNLNDPFLFRIEWITLWDYQNTIYVDEGMRVRETDFKAPPKTGTEFFNAVRDRYLWALNDQSIPDQRFHKKDKPEEWTYMVMERAKDGIGRIDNSRTSTTIQINNSPRYPQFSIGLELAKAMGWVKLGRLDDGKLGYLLGPNLRKEFNNNALPTATDVLTPAGNGDEMYYKIDPDALHLSTFINWVFMDLDGSYERAFGNNHRPLYLYSNAMQSMIVGNQVTDLMREIPYSLEQRQFVPDQVQYMPVRSDVMDIIETQVAESDGKLTDFVSGVSTVTLHFKYE